jgi:hypothetical protein
VKQAPRTERREGGYRRGEGRARRRQTDGTPEHRKKRGKSGSSGISKRATFFRFAERCVLHYLTGLTDGRNTMFDRRAQHLE